MLLGVAASGLAGCRDFFSDPLDDFELPDVNLDAFADATIDPTRGKGVGEACSAAAALPECRLGLKCIDAACKATGDTPANRPCMLTAECGDGLYCSVAGVCMPAGAGPSGSACGSSGDCEKGLVCQSLGFAGSCVAPGTGDVHAPCEDATECMAGLACGEDGTCVVGNLLYGPKLWKGTSCEPDAEDAAPIVHFAVPRGVQADDSDFFRLPFPNDIRMKDGFVDFTGFPTPGPGLVGFDPVKRLISAAGKVQRGASTEPAIIFRFSRVFDFASIWAAGVADPPPGEPTLYVVNIDKDSPQYGWTPDFGYFMTDGGTPYICPRYLAIHPSWNTPLMPGTTYAVILADGIAMPDGTKFGADADFQALVQATAPSGDDALAAAWQAYAPLRAYLADPEAAVPAGRVIAATVFTTQPVDDVLPRIREAIHAGPMPQPKELTLCDGTAKSPCDDGLSGEAHERGCFEVSPDAWELHLRVPLPKVQAGTRPYLSPDDGGDLVIAGDGSVALQGTEDVCVSVTIPKAMEMPASGWPLVVYGHGTGGTFRSSVRDAGLPLAKVTLDDAPAAPPIGVAALGWDGPMHGSRRGADLDPEGLFYHFANPLAARGNLYQGAADLFALVRAAKTWVIAAEQSPTGKEIRFDATRLLAFGHSQGATTGPLATPYEPDVRAIIWSGGGAGLVQSLLAKKSPVDAPRAVALALQEIDRSTNTLRELSDLHPALTLVQGLFDPIDPLNQARFQLRAPRAGMPVTHVLQSYGLGDTYTPPSTIETFGRLLGLAVAAPVLKDPGGATAKLSPPVKENLDVPGVGKATAVQIQVSPDGYDGHFVLFRDEGARHQLAQWVASFVRDGAPTLVARPTP